MSIQTLRWTLLTVALLAGSSRADDLKIAQMEQDIRELQQQVNRQARRIENLEGELARSRVSITPPADRSAAAEKDTQQPWLNVANWNRLKPGMTELDVIQLIGPPRSLRKAADGSQTLLYVMEIGVGSFLSGSVTLIDQRVTEVTKPSLK